MPPMGFRETVTTHIRASYAPPHFARQSGQTRIGCFAFFESRDTAWRAASRQGEIGADAVDFRLRQGQGAVAMLGKLGLDLGANNIGAFLMHQDLDARLVFVIAPPSRL